MRVTEAGVITGWLVGDAQIDDRWLLQALLRLRAAQPGLTQPSASASGKNRRLAFPANFPVPAVAAGQAFSHIYLADGGFGGARWQSIWRACGVVVLAPPPANAPDRWSRALRRWHARRRQPIETAFAHLTTAFAFAHVGAHSRWGQLTCLAAMFAAYNLGLWLNQPAGASLARPCHFDFLNYRTRPIGYPYIAAFIVAFLLG